MLMTAICGTPRRPVWFSPKPPLVMLTIGLRSHCIWNLEFRLRHRRRFGRSERCTPSPIPSWGPNLSRHACHPTVVPRASQAHQAMLTALIVPSPRSGISGIGGPLLQMRRMHAPSQVLSCSGDCSPEDGTDREGGPGGAGGLCCCENWASSHRGLQYL